MQDYNPLEVNRLAQEYIIAIEAWADRNCLSLNAAKCKILRYRNHFEPHFLIKGALILVVHSMKYLGMLFNSTLKWSSHIESVIHKASKAAALV